MKLPGPPILPITSTVDDDGTPTLCRVCSMRAMGIGVGFTSRQDKDPGWLCVECAVLIEAVRDMRRFDLYEIAALDGCVEALGEACQERGTFNLLDMDELDIKMMCKPVVIAFGDTLRAKLRSEAPF